MGLLDKIFGSAKAEGSADQPTYEIAEGDDAPIPEGEGPMFDEAALQAMRVDAPELIRVIEEGGGAFDIVDVREIPELAWGILPEAKVMPMSEIELRVGELDKNRTVVCYCEHGIRSLNVAAYLTSLGFKARSLNGGYAAWNGPRAEYQP